MPAGPSGRVVVEIDPALKKELYRNLTIEGLTLKDWFIQSAEEYLQQTHGLHSQPPCLKKGVL